eukprot:765674-Hanusia_phi.AAC.2
MRVCLTLSVLAASALRRSGQDECGGCWLTCCQRLVASLSRLGVIDMQDILDSIPSCDGGLFAASACRLRLVGVGRRPDREETMDDVIKALLPEVFDALSDVCLQDFVSSSQFSSPRLVREPLRVWHQLWNELNGDLSWFAEHGERTRIGETISLLRSTLSDVYFFHFHQEFESDLTTEFARKALGSQPRSVAIAPHPDKARTPRVASLGAKREDGDTKDVPGESVKLLLAVGCADVLRDVRLDAAPVEQQANDFLSFLKMKQENFSSWRSDQKYVERVEEQLLSLRSADWPSVFSFLGNFSSTNSQNVRQEPAKKQANEINPKTGSVSWHAALA